MNREKEQEIIDAFLNDVAITFDNEGLASIVGWELNIIVQLRLIEALERLAKRK